MKLSIATVGRKYDDLQREYAHFAWMTPLIRDPDHDLRFGIGTTAGRIDSDRSLFFEVARRAQDDWHLQRDTDIVVEVPAHRVLELLEQDRRAGFDCVISPISSVQMHLMAYPGEGRDASRTDPFQIEAGSAGFLALSKKALAALEVLGQFVTEDGKRTPAYCMMNLPNANGDPMTEDISLFANLRKGGIRSCADPRILSRHWKLEWGIPSYRPLPEQTIATAEV